MALAVLLLTIYVAIYDYRKSLTEKLFRIMKEKISQNRPVKEEADAVIGILYASNVEVVTPIYLMVNEDPMTDLMIVSLLRAALRYFNSGFEIELDGPGVVRMSAEDRKSLGKILQSEKTLESTIDFTRVPTIKKIDVLLTECSRASGGYAYIRKENGKSPDRFKPLFFIAQKTLKDPRRILFPHMTG